MISDWRPNLVTHLVMDELTFTIKVLNTTLLVFIWRFIKTSDNLDKGVLSVFVDSPTGHSCFS